MQHAPMAMMAKLTGAMILTTLAMPAWAQQATSVRLSVKEHRFQPAEVHAPANTPLTLTLKNLDATPMEFEGKTLRVEKIVPAGAEVSLQIRPLAPGRYRFFDDYKPDTTEGYLVIE